MSSSRLRELQADDADAVAALFVETYGDVRLIDAEEIRSWLANDQLRPEWLRVLELDGSIVGYGDISPDEKSLALDVAAPDHWDGFFEWAEDEAQERSLPEVRLYFAEGHELESVVARRGYSHWHSSFRMETELDEPAAPELPAGIEAGPYRDQDAETLRHALNEAFALDPTWNALTPELFRSWYLESRGFEPALWSLAWDGDRLAGFSLAYRGRGSDETLGWIGTLGVREPWRRRGLGEALLRTSFRQLWERRFHRAGLGVDARNVTGALRLYERAGMRQIHRSNGWSKRL
jgi:ribosomal protein S18 acetylase RimI-like enzyme